MATRVENIEVFRAGNYGTKGVWTVAELDAVASGYDPKKFESPLTVDHAQSGPAHGWVARLKRQGDLLLADIDFTDPAFAEDVRNRKFAKPSVEIYKSLSEMGGKPYLKAITLLGAKEPHIKGLKEIHFSAATEEAVHIDFNQETEDMSTPTAEQFAAEQAKAKELETKLKAAEDAVKAAKAEADKTAAKFSTDIKALQDQVASFEKTKTDAEKAAADKRTAEEKLVSFQKDLDATKADATRFQKELAETKLALNTMSAETARQARVAKFEKAFDEAIRAGKASKAEKDVELATFMASPADAKVTIGGVEKPLDDVFLAKFSSRPVAFNMGAPITSATRTTSVASEDPVEFSKQRWEKAMELQKADPKLSDTDALIAAEKALSGV